MVAVGLVLMVLALGGAAFLGWMALQSQWLVTLGPAGFQIGVMPITLFAAGAGSVVLLWLGAKLTGAGAKRRAARKQELKQLRTNAAAERQAPDRTRDRIDEGTG